MVESVIKSKGYIPRYCLNFCKAYTAAASSPEGESRFTSAPLQTREANAIGTSSLPCIWCKAAPIAVAEKSVYRRYFPSLVGATSHEVSDSASLRLRKLASYAAPHSQS